MPTKLTVAADRFYKSRSWQKCRQAYLRSVCGLCERCQKKGLIVPATEVHHKDRLTLVTVNDPAVALNFDNLEALCGECHRKQHSRRSIPRRYSVSSDDGQIDIED